MPSASARVLAALCVCQLIIFSHSALIGEECTAEANTCPANSNCVDGFCTCNKGYVGSGDKTRCLEATMYADGDCEVIEQCSLIPSTTCTDFVCKCNENFVSYDRTCIPRVASIETAACTQTLQCPANSRCSIVSSENEAERKQCICLNGFVANRGKTACLKAQLQAGEECEETAQCLGENTACTLNANDGKRRCTCSIGYIAGNNGECVPIVLTEGAECDVNSQCRVLNAECTDNKCKCREGTTSVPRSYCLPDNLSSPCFINAHCSRFGYSICNSWQCVCGEGYVASENSNACLKTIDNLNDKCEEDDQCILENTKCVDVDGERKCRCDTGYSPRPNQLGCVRMAEFVNDPCENNGQCQSLESSSFCSNPAKRCTCPQTHVAKYDLTTCLTKATNFTSTCEQLNQCMSNAICDTLTSKCICSDGFVQNTNSCLKVANILGESCSSSRQCPFENSDCISNKCQCKAPFTPDASNRICNSAPVNAVAAAIIAVSLLVVKLS